LIDRIDRAGAPTLLLGALIAAAPFAMDIYHPSDGVDDRRHVARCVREPPDRAPPAYAAQPMMRRRRRSAIASAP
jgi:hypothetical protein